MLLSGEDCRAILERLGYFRETISALRPTPSKLLYITTGEIPGPKAILLDIQDDERTHGDDFFGWLGELGIEADCLERLRKEFNA